MKSIFYSLFLVAVFTSCQNSPKNLGQTFTPKQPVSVSIVMGELQTTPKLSDVQIEGVVENSCKGEGCWFTIKDSAGTEITFDIADKKFSIPKDSPGKTVVVLADAAQDSTAEQKAVLSVKGLMFK
jgi:hypothetical protein